MGHYVEDTGCLFKSVRYNTKSTAEVRAAMERKTVALEALLAGRDARVRQLRDEYRIDAERLASLVLQFQRGDGRVVSYNAQGAGGDAVAVPAGVIANILREHEMIDSERAQLRKLQLILRNLTETEPYADPKTGEVRTRACLHTLTDAELEYLDF